MVTQTNIRLPELPRELPELPRELPKLPRFIFFSNNCNSVTDNNNYNLNYIYLRDSSKVSIKSVQQNNLEHSFKIKVFSATFCMYFFSFLISIKFQGKIKLESLKYTPRSVIGYSSRK